MYSRFAARLRAAWPLLAVVLSSLLSFLPAHAASNPIPVRIGSSVAVLSGPWKFHPGDDLAWAQPDVNDADWGTMDLTPPEGSYDPVTGSSGYTPGWTMRGYPKLVGHAWYRLRLNVENQGGGDLALTLPINFDDAYEVYVNGRKIGGFGRFTGTRAIYYNAQPRSFPLPPEVRGGPITIAIRMWMDDGTPLFSQDAGGLHGPPMLGQADSIEAMLRLEWDSVNRTELGNLASASFAALAALLGFTLFGLDRREPVYLWLALSCVVAALSRISVLIGYYMMIEPMVQETVFQDVVLMPLTLGLWAMFWASWFRLKELKLVTRVTVVLMCAEAFCVAMLRPPLYGVWVPASISTWMLPVSLAIKLGLGAVLLWITVMGIRKRASGAWLAIVPVLLTIAWEYNEELATVHIPQIVAVGGLIMSTGQISNILMLAIIAVLLMQRFILGQREREHLMLEIEQARQVQQVLIPEALPAMPGFKLASEYRPAQEVGGDFFQIIPVGNGGVLAIVGDVSGKGMPAAMTVSLLVGTVRTLAHFTCRPGEMLSAMNVRMLSRQQGGFTTCLVMHVSAEGDVTVANAGHLAPYLDGKELAGETGLPLGLSADAKYPETYFRLAPAQQLTVITDGVVEARNHKGELLGFDRTEAMAGQSAESIAQAAQDFGQEDDITVLTLVRLSMGEEPAMVVSTMLLSSSPA